ncbi:MAG: metallophosphoesterase [Acidobacteriota bacterium]|nr:metallophosphoesterase [Acidobacteriota bacterium]
MTRLRRKRRLNRLDRPRLIGKPAFLILFAIIPLWAQTVHFAVIGDRTGEHAAGVYEKVWNAVAAEKPAFVLSVGDTIEGGRDAAADAEWREVLRGLPSLPFYLAPGNHDVWSAMSADLYRKYSKRDLRYSFDAGSAHFTVLDNSRSDAMPDAEMAFLEEDLKAHSAQPVKFVVSHRPSWLIPAVLGDRSFPLQRLAKKYGVQYVIAGHLHEMLHAEVDGVHYVSMASAGGHLRASEKYEDGWFFGYAVVDAGKSGVKFTIHELNGRTTDLALWGKAGLK